MEKRSNKMVIIYTGCSVDSSGVLVVVPLKAWILSIQLYQYGTHLCEGKKRRKRVTDWTKKNKKKTKNRIVYSLDNLRFISGNLFIFPSNHTSKVVS